jgi:hypothetical protein
MYYNAGVVVVNSEVIGLAPEPVLKLRRSPEFELSMVV